MAEYEMRDAGVVGNIRRIEIQNGWQTHNVDDILRIFYKNFIMTIDNAVVRKKYSK